MSENAIVDDKRRADGHADLDGLVERCPASPLEGAASPLEGLVERGPAELEGAELEDAALPQGVVSARASRAEERDGLIDKDPSEGVPPRSLSPDAIVNGKGNGKSPAKVSSARLVNDPSVGDGGDNDKSCFTASCAFRVTMMLFLVCQNAALVLLMRMSRTEVGEDENGDDMMWNPQTGVILQDVLKVIICGSVALASGEKPSAMAGGRYEILRSGVPAFTYLLQNNVLYIAISYIDAPSFSAMSQLKILTAAGFTVLILKRSIRCRQWVALFALLLGVIVVQSSADPSKQVADTGDDESGTGDDSGRHLTMYIFGMSMMLVTATLSGFAGVYTELVLKTSDMSLWSRNVHFSLYGCTVGLATFAISGGSVDAFQTFFHGYTRWSVATIIVQAIGGILVSVVVKYIDCIAKNICVVGGLVLTVLGAVLWMGRDVDWQLIAGMFVISCSVWAYNTAPTKRPSVEQPSREEISGSLPKVIGSSCEIADDTDSPLSRLEKGRAMVVDLASRDVYSPRGPHIGVSIDRIDDTDASATEEALATGEIR